MKVGATLVGRITVTYDADLVGNTSNRKAQTKRYDRPALIAKGADLGAFELGSTVVVLAEAGKLDLRELQWGQRVFVGQKVGVLRQPGNDRPLDQEQPSTVAE